MNLFLAAFAHRFADRAARGLCRLAAWAERQPRHRRLGAWTVS